MARGWESKSVESQQDAGAEASRQGRPSLEERQREQRRHGLELSLARVRNELAVTTAPARRTALESALQQLEGELAALVRPSGRGR